MDRSADRLTVRSDRPILLANNDTHISVLVLVIINKPKSSWQLQSASKNNFELQTLNVNFKLVKSNSTLILYFKLKNSNS